MVVLLSLHTAVAPNYWPPKWIKMDDSTLHMTPWSETLKLNLDRQLSMPLLCSCGASFVCSAFTVPAGVLKALSKTTEARPAAEVVIPSRCLVSAWLHISLQRLCVHFKNALYIIIQFKDSHNDNDLQSAALSQVSKICLRHKSGYNAPLPMSQQSNWPERAADHPKWRAKSLVFQAVKNSPQRTRNYEKILILLDIVPRQTNRMKPFSSHCVSLQQEFTYWHGPYCKSLTHRYALIDQSHDGRSQIVCRFTWMLLLEPREILRSHDARVTSTALFVQSCHPVDVMMA